MKIESYSRILRTILSLIVGYFMIGVGVYGCKKQEPVSEDTTPIESIEPAREESLPDKSVSLDDELYKQTKIAFLSYRKEDARPGTPAYLQEAWFEFYVMNTDGSQQKRLTSNRLGSPVHPTWSPDGKKIAFVLRTDREMEYDIYVINADGSGNKRLTSSPGWDHDLTWSPDGKKIAFVSNRDGNKEIYIMNPDGSEQKNLTNNPAPDMCPSWSPFLPLENDKEKE